MKIVKFIEHLLFSEYWLEARRKLAHIFIGITTLLAHQELWLGNIQNIIVFRSVILVMYLILTNAHYARVLLAKISQRAIDIFERNDTRISGFGALTLWIGIISPILLGFSDTTVITVVLTLSLGDGLATLAGRYLGKHALPIPGTSRSWMGSIIGYLAVIVGLYAFGELNFTTAHIALIGMLIEFILGTNIISKKFKKISRWYSLDNLFISIIMMLLFWIIS